MLFAADDHASNPPETWIVERSTHSHQPWSLRTKDGVTLSSQHATKREALALKTAGFYFNLYRDEGRWYAGENVRNWKSVQTVTDLEPVGLAEIRCARCTHRETDHGRFYRRTWSAHCRVKGCDCQWPQAEDGDLL